MIRTFCTLAVTCLILASPFQVIAQGSDGGKKEKDDPADIKTVVKLLEGMKEDIKESFLKVGTDMLKFQTDIDALKLSNKMLRDDYVAARIRADAQAEQIKILRGEIENLKKGNGSSDSLPPPDKILEEIRVKVYQIEQNLSKMQPATTREAKSSPSTGRILLANHYADEMTFFINDKRMVVPAKSTMLIEDVPAGTFAYKVVHAAYGERSSNPAATLVPGQTYTLTVREARQ